MTSLLGIQGAKEESFMNIEGFLKKHEAEYGIYECIHVCDCACINPQHGS